MEIEDNKKEENNDNKNKENNDNKNENKNLPPIKKPFRQESAIKRKPFDFKLNNINNNNNDNNNNTKLNNNNNITNISCFKYISFINEGKLMKKKMNYLVIKITMKKNQVKKRR